MTYDYPSSRPLADNLDQAAIFLPDSKLRLATLDVLSTEPHHASDLDRYRSCGTTAWVDYSPTTASYRVRANHCGLRYCPRCQRLRAHQAADQLRDYLGHIDRNSYKLITLTLRHSSAPLDRQLDLLVASFRRLRQRKLWRSYVTGGYAVIEITYNPAKLEWHPHLHIIARCKYIPHHALAATWLAVTHTSMIVDIRVIRDAPHAARYIAKYLGKSPDWLAYDASHDRLREYLNAIRRRRLLIRFGDTPVLRRQPTPPVPPTTDWEPVSPLLTLLADARSGDTTAQAIVSKALHSPWDTISSRLDAIRHRTHDPPTTR